MNGNIKQAKAALEAEITHARQGVDWWTKRLDKLREMRMGLDKIAEDPIIKEIHSQPLGDTTKQSRQNDKLPSTGGTFWHEQFSTSPQLISDVLATAMKNLGVPNTEENKKKLAGRLTTATRKLIEAGVVKTSGKGRNRTYVRQP